MNTLPSAAGFDVLLERPPYDFLDLPDGVATAWTFFEEGDVDAIARVLSQVGLPFQLWLAHASERGNRFHQARRSFGQHGRLGATVTNQSSLDLDSAITVYSDVALADQEVVHEASRILVADDSRSSCAAVWRGGKATVPLSIWALLTSVWVQTRYGSDEASRYQLLQSLFAETSAADVLLCLPVEYQERHRAGIVLIGNEVQVASAASRFNGADERVDSLERAWAEGLAIALTSG